MPVISEEGGDVTSQPSSRTGHVDCSGTELTYGRQLRDDVLRRTETAIPQAHCFLAMELALRAQAAAQWIQGKRP